MGAVAHAIKSVAQRKGWRHGSHGLLLVTVNRLLAEAGAPPHLKGQYHLACEFHSGFYGDYEFTAGEIRIAKVTMAEFVRALERLE